MRYVGAATAGLSIFLFFFFPSLAEHYFITRRNSVEDSGIDRRTREDDVQMHKRRRECRGSFVVVLKFPVIDVIFPRRRVVFAVAPRSEELTSVAEIEMPPLSLGAR